MFSKTTRALAAIFTLLLTLTIFPACQKADPLAKSGINSITLDKNGKITVTATLELTRPELNDRGTAYLYELLPGETSIEGKEPLDEAKPAHTMTFETTLKDGDRSRLFSSFVIAFSGGTLLDPDPYWIENPQQLATNRQSFPWESSPKGLSISNPEKAVEDGSMHAMLSISLAELSGADGGLSDTAITYLDRQIGPASKSGMQVSLTLSHSGISSYPQFASILSALTARYNGGEHGTLSALFLPFAEKTDNALVCRLACLALRSQIANGRVYMLSTAKTLARTKINFSNLQTQLAAGGDLKWGAAVSMPSIPLPWELENKTDLSANNLRELSDLLLTSQKDAAVSWFALCDLSFADPDTERQAAAFAYTYRRAVDAGAGLIFFGKQYDDAEGLYHTDGTESRLAATFRLVDCGLSAEDVALCRRYIGESWDHGMTPAYISRTLLRGVSNVGTAGLSEEPFVDFADGALHGFCSIASMEDATTRLSGALGAQALMIWADPESPAKSGVRRVFATAEELVDVSALSIRYLAQLPGGQGYRLQLTLDGYTQTGTRQTYQSSIEATDASWQTATFQIAAFTADLDPQKPCVMSLLIHPNGEVDEEFAFWVRDIYYRMPAKSPNFFLPVALAVVALAVAFVLVMILYRRSARR